MRRARSAAVVAIPVAVSVALAAACATNDGDPLSPEPVPSQALPDASTGDVAAPVADASCDGNGCGPRPACVPGQVDFCSMAEVVPPLVTLNAVWGSSAADIYAVGNLGTILHGDGKTFAPVVSGTTELLLSVWGSGPNDVWIVSGSAPLHASALPDGGTTVERKEGASWQPQSATSGRVWSVWGSSAANVLLAGAYSQRFGGSGAILWQKSDVAWTPIAAPPCYTCQLRSLWGTSSTFAWAVGNGGETLRLEPGGSWTAHESRTSKNLEAVWGASPTTVWAVGENGTIRTFTNDASQRWTIVPAPTSVALHGIWGTSATNIWAVGDEGVVLHYDGTAWKEAALDFGEAPRTNLYAIWGTSADDVWIVGEGALLHRTAKNRRIP